LAVIVIVASILTWGAANYKVRPTITDVDFIAARAVCWFKLVRDSILVAVTDHAPHLLHSVNPILLKCLCDSMNEAVWVVQLRDILLFVCGK
jgi:hypothetical protein